MNPYTGHIVDLSSLSEEEKQILFEKYYEPVPSELHIAAKKVLAGRDEAYVSLNSGGKLSRWAAKKRKAKRKMIEASKKRNRK